MKKKGCGWKTNAEKYNKSDKGMNKTIAVLAMMTMAVGISFATKTYRKPTNRTASLPTQAKGYNINVRAHQLANRMVYLGSYLDGKIYSVDTLRLDSNGQGRFSKKKKLPEGLYMLYVNEKSKYYEFLIGDVQDIGILLSDTTKAIGECMSVSGAEQTIEFVELGKYMTLQRQKQMQLLKERRGTNDDKKIKLIDSQLEQLNKDVETHQNEVAERYKGKMLGVFVKSLIAPKFPESLLNADDKDEKTQMARYQYAKRHFWDNIDLSDRRVWRMNMLHERLNNFMSKHIIQVPDSITPEGIRLIEMSKGDSVSFNLMTNYVITYAVQSKMMGMDKLFAQIAEKFFFTGEAYWADSTLMSNIETEYNKVRYNQIGMKAHNMPLKNLNGIDFNLYDISKPYTLVYFYEPTCGHCQHTTPKIHDVYEKYKSKGFEVVAIYLMTDKKEWTDFIQKDNLYDWTNAWDPERKSLYWVYFDTSTTPGVYLLDKDKNIIAKKIDAESLDRVLDYEINGQKNGNRMQASAKVADYELPIDVNVNSDGDN